MPAKKKAPSRTRKTKKSTAKPRGAVTTVDSTAKVNTNQTTKASSAAPALAPEKTPGKSPVKIAYPPRERRRNPDGRRGRFAEKTPPGTRTKMLKIIYDRKAEMAKKRQHALIGKFVLGIVLVTSLYYGAQHAMSLATQGATAVVEMLDLQGWWSNVATKKPGQNSHYRTPPRQPSKAQVRPTYRQKPRSTGAKAYEKRRVSKKYVKKQTTYGKTRVYRGKNVRRQR